MAGALRALGGALLACVLAACTQQAGDRAVEAAEAHYADYVDAAGARDTIASGLMTQVDGADRATWQRRYDRSLVALHEAIDDLDAEGLSPENARALQAMRDGIAWRDTGSLTPDGDCADARRQNATGDELNAALYACFSSEGDNIRFEGRTLARTAALAELERIEEPARRRALFVAMSPLWRAVNADNRGSSPYRRLIALQAEEARAIIAAAESAIGIEPGQAEAWLVQALEAWRGEDAPLIEPWDFRYSYAKAARDTAQCTPLENLRDANNRYFAALGADLDQLGVIQDVGNRPGMAPVDYADFVRVGREIDGAWRPAIPRISVILQEGGIGHAAELAHENGHAAHYSAMRTRPSLTMPDDLTVAIEAFADINAWSVYTPEWQQEFLGCAASEADNMRNRLGAVMLDMAWGLFEIRMSRDPEQDPNAVWTEITRDHLGIAPHPELSWWAVRGQLVDSPGYMIHYALGAFITADVRARIESAVGPFDAGNRRWYGHVSDRLYRFGGARPPAELLRAYLGRPVSPDALIADISRANAT